MVNLEHNILYLEHLLFILNHYYTVIDAVDDREIFCEDFLNQNFLDDASFLEYTLEYLKSSSTSIYDFLRLKAEEKVRFLFDFVLIELLDCYRIDLLNILTRKEKRNFQAEDIFAFSNMEALKQKISEYQKEEGYEVTLEEVSIDETVFIVKEFLKFIDPTFELYHLFLEGIENETICIWNIYGDFVPDVLYEKLCADRMFSWLTLKEEATFINAPCEGTVLDVFCLIHEFFHFVSLKKLEYFSVAKNISGNFFLEFASIFYETFLSQYLLEYFPFLKNSNFILTYRNHTNYEIKPFLLRLYQMMDLKSIDNSYSFEYLDDFLLNIVLFSGNYFGNYRYFVATWMTTLIMEKIQNGKTYLLERVKHVAEFILYTDMDPMYIIRYLECNELFLGFRAVSDKVIPKRIPVLKK